MLGTATALMERFCERVVVVLSAEDQVDQACLDCGRAERFYSQRASQGMGYSLADVAAWLPAHDPLLVMLADKPFVRACTVQTVQARMTPDTIVVPRWQQQGGHPVGFGENLRHLLLDLEGDAGARGLIRTHPDLVDAVEVEDEAIVVDIDTPEQLRSACQRFPVDE